MIDENIAFYGIIPAPVLFDDTISDGARKLYSVITMLMKGDGCCWASNDYLAKLFRASKSTITNWVSELAKAGHIVVQVAPNRESGGTNRYIYPSINPPEIKGGCSQKFKSTPSQFSGTPPSQEFKRVVTEISESHIIDNNKKKIKKKKAARDAELYESQLLEKCVLFGPNVLQAMKDYLDTRASIGKPADTQAIATRLYNKLVKFSDGDPARMEHILDKAINGKWRDLYPCDFSGYPAPGTQVGAAEPDTVEMGGGRFI